jgi:hypothetical protein
MGVDFTAILDHRLSWEEICRLPATLNSRWSSPSSLVAFTARFPNAGKDWHWRISPTFSSPAEELFDEGYVRLEGPSCFSVGVFKQALEVTSSARWWSFLFQEDVRAGLLEGVRQLAGVLRSSTIVYLPDSAFPPSVASDRLYEGGGMAEVVDWLQANVGSAASSIDAIRGADEDHWDESGYVVERVEAAV